MSSTCHLRISAGHESDEAAIASRNFNARSTKQISSHSLHSTCENVTKVSFTVSCSLYGTTSRHSSWLMRPQLPSSILKSNINTIFKRPRHCFCDSKGYCLLYCKISHYNLLSCRSRQLERLSASMLSICSSVCLSPKRNKTRFCQKAI